MELDSEDGRVESAKLDGALSNDAWLAASGSADPSRRTPEAGRRASTRNSTGRDVAVSVSVVTAGEATQRMNVPSNDRELRVARRVDADLQAAVPGLHGGIVHVVGVAERLDVVAQDERDDRAELARTRGSSSEAGRAWRGFSR